MLPFNKKALKRSEIPENSMFGKRVEENVDDNGVSLFVVWCIEAIERTGLGLRTDGLYRASGSKRLVDEIVGMEKEVMVDVLGAEKNIHVLAGALKKFLDCLEEPLLVTENFRFGIDNESKMENYEKNDERIIKYTQSLNSFTSREACSTLKFILEHLLCVAQFPSDNNMGINNLASIFGPILVRSLNKNKTDTDLQIQVTQFILWNYNNIFENVLQKESKMYRKKSTYDIARATHGCEQGTFTRTVEPEFVNAPRRVSQAEEACEAREISEKSVQSSMFGGYLKDTVDKETGVSQFVVWCVRAVESTGDNLKTDALYRASGNQAKVQEIAITAHKNMQEKLEKEVNVNVLTGALKLFFRQLKEPILDYNKFQDLPQQSRDDHQDSCREAKILIEGLGDVEQATLKFMLKHLKEVLKHSASNNMGVESMGVVFGPTLMRLSDDTVNMAGDLRQQNKIVEFLLDNYDHIFTT